MPTPKSGYYTKAGVRVPGVTTVIGRFKDSGGLIHWANTIAYEPWRKARALIEQAVQIGVLSPGLIGDMKELLAKPADFCDYRKVRDTAAGIGTIVHGRIDCWIRGTKFEPSEYTSDEIKDPIAASEAGFGAFLDWATQTKLRLEQGEIQLVSELFGYGGTPDVVFVADHACLGDWKTGDLYPEQLLPQLAAYRQLLVENGRDNVGQDAYAISVNKSTGGFTYRHFTPEEMTKGWRIFRGMREIYEALKEVK